MIQQSHQWAYTLRKPQFSKAYVPQCSLQHYLPQPRHGNNLDVNIEGVGGGRCILYIYIYKYYSAIKRNKFESVVVRWMNLESVILNEISQKEKNKHHILSPSGSVGKESACNAGDRASIPGSGRSPGGRNGNPLQYSCLERIPWTEEPGRLAKSQI